MAGRAKENLPGGSLKYLFVYLKVRIFKCILNVVTVYIYIYLLWPSLIWEFGTRPRSRIAEFGSASFLLSHQSRGVGSVQDTRRIHLKTSRNNSRIWFQNRLYGYRLYPQIHPNPMSVKNTVKIRNPKKHQSGYVWMQSHPPIFCDSYIFSRLERHGGPKSQPFF